MPASDPKSVIEIRFNTPEEKKHYQSKVSEKSSLGFAKWGAQLVREHFKGESLDSPLVVNLKQQLEELTNEFQRMESENLYLRRSMDSKSKELLEVRGRLYRKPEIYSAELFQMMYSWFIEHKQTTRKELLRHIEDAVKVPNLIQEIKAIEVILISQGIIEVEDGRIHCLVEE